VLSAVWVAAFVIAFLSVGVVFALHGAAFAATDDYTWQYEGLGGRASAFDIGGDGTADRPFRISTAGQLAYLAHRVNSSNLTDSGYGESFYGMHFILTTNINLNIPAWSGGPARAWVSIGGYDRPFMGIFDGNDYTITLPNRIIAGVQTGGTQSDIDEDIDASGIRRWGLFGRIEHGTIRNLNIAGSVTTLTTPGTGNITAAYIGLLAGEVLGDTLIENVVNRADARGIGNNILGRPNLIWPQGQDVFSNNRFGGLIGSAGHNLILRNVANYGTLATNAVSGHGGLVGRIIGTATFPANVSILNSYNRGYISGANNLAFGGVGGLVGLNSMGTLNIVNSFNIGAVYSPVLIGSGGAPGGSIFGRSMNGVVSITNVVASVHPYGAPVYGVVFGPAVTQRLVAGTTEAGVILTLDANWSGNSPATSRRTSVIDQMNYGLENTTIISEAQRSFMAGWVSSTILGSPLVPEHNFSNYTVVFNVMGALNVEGEPIRVPSQAVFEGLPITPPDMTLPQFRFPGHGFVHWTERQGDDSATGAFDFTQLVERDIVLYAIWQVGSNRIELNFNNGAMGVAGIPQLVMYDPGLSSGEYIVGSNHLPVPPSDVLRESGTNGVVFLGWATSEVYAANGWVLNNWSGHWAVGNMVNVTEDMILWAVYRERNPFEDYRQLNLVFASPGLHIGQEFATLEQDEMFFSNLVVNTAPVMNTLVPNIPQVPGFVFQGWATSRDFANRGIMAIVHDEPVIIYGPSGEIRQLYAVWSNLRIAQVVFHMNAQVDNGAGGFINVNMAPRYASFATGNRLGWSLDEAFDATNVLNGNFGFPSGLTFVRWDVVGEDNFVLVRNLTTGLFEQSTTLGVGQQFLLNRHVELQAVFVFMP